MIIFAWGINDGNTIIMIHNILMQVQSDSVPNLHKAVIDVAENIQQGNVQWNKVMDQLMTWALDAGRHILIALVVYIVGHYLIKLLNYLLAKLLEKRKVEVSLQTFLKSFVSILLQVLLIVTVVGALGVNTTSFAALLASFGMAVGMALSGNLQNFAGGIVILFLKPYKVGDWIEAQGSAGTVSSIQIFHTILQTNDGKLVHLPNGAMSSGAIVNYSQSPMRLVEWVMSVEYGEDVEKVRQTTLDVLKSDARIQSDPAPVVWLKELAASSVDVVIRCWVLNADYWDVKFQMTEKIYNAYNQQGIGFPFPQVTVHQAEK